MSRYDVRAAREAVRRSLGRVHPLTVSGDLGELQGQLPVVFPRHLLAVYRLAHLAALQGLVLADRRVLVRGRLSRRQRLTAAHPQVRGDRRYPPLGRITEPARIAAAVYDEVLWQFPHRAGRLAYAEALACPEGLVQQACEYGRDPFTSRVGGDGECPEDLYPEAWRHEWPGAQASILFRGPTQSGGDGAAFALAFYEELVSVGYRPPLGPGPVFLYADPHSVGRLEVALAERGWPARLPG